MPSSERSSAWMVTRRIPRCVQMACLMRIVVLEVVPVHGQGEPLAHERFPQVGRLLQPAVDLGDHPLLGFQLGVEYHDLENLGPPRATDVEPPRGDEASQRPPHGRRMTAGQLRQLFGGRFGHAISIRGQKLDGGVRDLRLGMDGLGTEKVNRKERPVSPGEQAGVERGESFQLGVPRWDAGVREAAELHKVCLILGPKLEPCPQDLRRRGQLVVQEDGPSRRWARVAYAGGARAGWCRFCA